LDNGYPNSRGYSQTRTYNTNVFKNLMKNVQEWTKIIEKNEDDKELDGLDFMMTVESNPFPSYIPKFANLPLMGVEVVDSTGNNANSKYFQEVVKNSEEGISDVDHAISNSKVILTIDVHYHICRTFSCVIGHL
jgi:hypothetical protein